MHITWTVDVELSRESGKFASREDVTEYLAEQIEQALMDGADGVGPDGDSVYVADDISIVDHPPLRRKRVTA